MNNKADLIWIQDAAKDYDRSRKWLDDQVAAGKLHYATFEGDRRVYLLRSELNELLRPTIHHASNDSRAV